MPFPEPGAVLAGLPFPSPGLVRQDHRPPRPASSISPGGLHSAPGPCEDNLQGNTSGRCPRRAEAGALGQGISRPHSLSGSPGVGRKQGPLRWSWKFFLSSEYHWSALGGSLPSDFCFCRVRRGAVNCRDLETFGARRVQVPKLSPHLPHPPSPGSLGNERAVEAAKERRRPQPGPRPLLFTLDVPQAPPRALRELSEHAQRPTPAIVWPAEACLSMGSSPSGFCALEPGPGRESVFLIGYSKWQGESCPTLHVSDENTEVLRSNLSYLRTCGTNQPLRLTRER